MCTLIVSIRTVLWYVMSLAGTLLVLVAVFTNKWLEGHVEVSNLSSASGIVDTALSVGNSVIEGEVAHALDKNVGLFLNCKVPAGNKFFQGECIPDWNSVKMMFAELNEDKYPHAWRGSVVCFIFGLIIMVLTDVFALLTICFRRCVCCSVFTVCGSLQSFAAILFTLGLMAYPAGWGSNVVKENYCGGQSGIFKLGDVCNIGFAFWMAAGGTLCTVLASSFAICAYQSTHSQKCDERIDRGEKYICLP